MTALAPTGEPLVLALDRAVRLERHAVLAEEAGQPAQDLWAMAAELRVECGQPLSTARAAAVDRRITAPQWRRQLPSTP